MEIDNLRHLYYRGVLKSCNYSCHYCPFAKRKMNDGELQKDKTALFRFIQWVESAPLKKPISIMLTPYGEAMIHRYYWQALARLTKCPQVAKVSVQTNLSFDANEFLTALKDERAVLEKIALWATFHPTMVDEKFFCQKANKLAQVLDLSVGMVGDINKLPLMMQMKENLSERIYFWLNKMDGASKKLTAAEKDSLAALDKNYLLEERRFACDGNKCLGGKDSFFVESDGALYPCNRNKNCIGNLYQEEPLQQCAYHGRCDCFLAYANRKDLPSLLELGPYPQLRLKGAGAKAYFFDIDGTLLNSAGCLEASMVEMIKRLARKSDIYLVTALPLEAARVKSRRIWNDLTGGIFAYGAYWQDFTDGEIKIEPLTIPSGIAVKKVYCYNAICYKAILAKIPKIPISAGRVIEENGIVSLVAKDVSKESAILEICQKKQYQTDDIVPVGNSKIDAAMLALTPMSIAPLNAESEAKNAARLVIDLGTLQ